MRKLIRISIMAILLTSLLGVTFRIEKVQASGTIYIRADGSIEPLTANITSADNVTYTFTGNVSDGIVAERNDTIIDGDEYTLQGSGDGVGLNLTNVHNITIRNMNINNFEYGIRLEASSKISIQGNNITNNNEDGIHLESSTYNTISGNNITNNDEGVKLYSTSNNNTVSGNNITNSILGLRLSSSNNNTISGNHITANTLVGVGLSSSSNYNTVSGNNITNNWPGINIDNSNYNTVSGNNITANKLVGVSLAFSSTYNTISGNNITANNDKGVRFVFSSNYNTVSGNNITNNGYGIRLESSSSYNSISGNNIGNNYYGINLPDSSSNRVFHNNFVNNTIQLYSINSVNIWDDGYPSGGNYWSNYTGVDSDLDGIGDSQHVIDANNQDNYPLMGMFSSFNITSEHYIQTICNSTISDFQHNGTAISFDVTGENGTSGFCRICIPKALMNETYRVFVNGTEILPSPELLPFSNSTHSFLYFTYDLSTKEVMIIPEFPSLIILPLFLITCLAVSLVRKRLHKGMTHLYL